MNQRLQYKLYHWMGNLRLICSSLLLLLVFCQVTCAQFRLPAIDPLGRGLFLPQGSTQILRNPLRPTQSPNGVFQPQAFSQAQSQFQRQGFQNQPVSRQPAFQQPATPPPCDGSDVRRSQQKKHFIPNPTDKKSRGELGEIIMTPSRIVAPVGSEVVVLAGICGGDGFYVKNQPLEWLISNNSVGELIEVGGMHKTTFNKLIPPTAKKFNGQYAWGRTSLKNIVLTRGTPTNVDDIELRSGQTFASVSSASPGTTYITAVAPRAEAWDKRRASTIIHWVDGKWSVPAPTRATAGTVHPLTTVVASIEDGSGLKDWEVRYAIVGGAPAEFAPSGSQTAVAKTNTDGQATVQIRQPAGQFSPGTSQVRVDIVRPAVFGEKELVVESGLTTVTWSAPALTIRAIGPRKAEFDEPFNYRVEVTNPGDQVSRNVVVRTKNLDDGIEFISSTPKPTQYGRNFEWQLGDITPGTAPKMLNIQMKSKKRGNVGMCFEVASATDRLQTDACAETEIILPCIGFNVDGPSTARVGDSISYRLNLENQCDEPLENVRVKVAYDTGLVRPGKSNPAIFVLDDDQGAPFLQQGESRSLPITFDVQSPGTRCFEVEITAQGVQPKLERYCVEVEAPVGGGSDGGGSSVLNGGAGSAGQGAGQNDPNSPLQISISGSQETEVGGVPLVEAQVTNRGNVPLERVTLVNRFDSSLSPNRITQEFWENHQLIGDELFINVGTIAPGQTVPIEFEYNALQIDPDAQISMNVTAPTGESATATSGIRIGAAGSGGGGAGVGGQNFGGDGIGIPGDSEPQSGGPAIEGLEVRVQTLNPSIRVNDLSKIQFSIKNSTQQSIKNVNMRLLVPNSVSFENLYSDSNIGLVNQYEFATIRELRAGESIGWVADVKGVTPGQAVFEVQAKSDDTFGISNANDAIYITQ